MKIRKLLVIILFYSLLIGCFNKQKGQKTVNGDASELRDSSYIFDGKTLTGWEITNFGPQGPVFISDDQVVLGMGDGCTGLTWTKEFPTVDYEVTLEAKRVDGNDFFCGMTFPAGKDPCTLIVGGWGGTVVGLSSINGMDASENETSTLRQFEKERWYRIRLRVTGDTIQAWIDDEIVVDFAIGSNLLSIRPEVELSRPFGIASWRTTAAIRNIKVVNI